jgi:hypothetical protein
VKSVSTTCFGVHTRDSPPIFSNIIIKQNEEQRYFQKRSTESIAYNTGINIILDIHGYLAILPYMIKERSK